MGEICPQCGIRFPYTSDADTAPSFEKVRFIVKYDDDAISGMLGSSFFPSYPKEKRFITVTPTFFAKDNSFSQAGILREQIGHALGYRHAHISPLTPPGCPKEDQSYFVGAKYDPKSVMHYLCGGGGTKEMRLSAMDIASHQLLYGFATIQVDIEGRRMLATAARILQSLSEQYGRLPLQTFDVKSDKGCRTYVETLGLLDELNVSPSPAGNGCAEFAPLLRGESGPARLPVLQFSGYTDVASGSFLDSNTAARENSTSCESGLGQATPPLVPRAPPTRNSRNIRCNGSATARTSLSRRSSCARYGQFSPSSARTIATSALAFRFNRTIARNREGPFAQLCEPAKYFDAGTSSRLPRTNLRTERHRWSLRDASGRQNRSSGRGSGTQV